MGERPRGRLTESHSTSKVRVLDCRRRGAHSLPPPLSAWQKYCDGRYQEAFTILTPHTHTLTSPHLTTAAGLLVGACHFKMVRVHPLCMYSIYIFLI